MAFDAGTWLEAALRCGISALEYWDMTPRETLLAIRARSEQVYKERLTQAWQTAALTRAKRLPKLDQLLAGRARPLRGEELKKRREEHEELTKRLSVDKINEIMRRKTKRD